MNNLFTPIQTNILEEYDSSEWGSHVEMHLDSFPSLEDKLIAIIGVPDDRGSIDNKGSKAAAESIRKQFFKLKCWHPNIKIVDLGDLVLGKAKEDTYNNLSKVLQNLKKQRIISVILGGSHDITIGQMGAFDSDSDKANLTIIDEKINYELSNVGSITSNNFLNNIFNEHINNIDLYSHLAFQSYFVSLETLDKLNKHHFQALRLGFLKNHIQEIEPVLRDTDVLSFDLSAITQADAPTNKIPSPSGLSGEQACQILRYAGLSDKMSNVGLYELNTACDNKEQTALLTAQMMWYFVDGFSHRKVELPTLDHKNFMKFVVSIKADGHELVFWKHKNTEKWWVEVPTSADSKLIACSYRDYQIACNEELPEKWLNALQRYS